MQIGLAASFLLNITFITTFSTLLARVFQFDDIIEDFFHHLFRLVVAVFAVFSFDRFVCTVFPFLRQSIFLQLLFCELWDVFTSVLVVLIFCLLLQSCHSLSLPFDQLSMICWYLLYFDIFNISVFFGEETAVEFREGVCNAFP